MAFRSKLNILALNNPGSKIPPPSFVLYMVMELMEFWSPKECLNENSSHCVIVIDLQHEFITAWVNISHLCCGLQCSLLKVRVDHASNTAAVQPRLWICQVGPGDFEETLWNVELVQKDAEFFFLIFVDDIFKQNVWFFYELKCGSLKQCAVQRC